MTETTHDKQKVFSFSEILILCWKLTWLIEWPLTALDSDQGWNHLLYFYFILIYRIHRLQNGAMKMPFPISERNLKNPLFKWETTWYSRIHCQMWETRLKAQTAPRGVLHIQRIFPKKLSNFFFSVFFNFIIKACFNTWFWMAGIRISVLDIR